MDPITTAIIAGLAAGAMQVGTGAVVDAYQALKAAITRKLGGDHAVAQAVEGLEAKPDSEARKAVLQEEVAAAKADQDPDLRAAAQAVLDQIKAQPGGEQHIQQAIGNYIAQADRQSSATVRVNQPET
jgi:hypothetical protein